MGILGFVIFASVELLYQLSDIIVRHRVGILKLFELIYFNIPYFISLGIPVGILFAIFWVLSQLYNSKEITALLVHGIPSKRLVLPFFLLSILFGLFAFYLNDKVVPNYNQKAVEVVSKYVYRTPELNIRENVLTKIDDKQYFFVKKYDQEKGILYDVVLFQNVSNEERIVTAERVIKEDNSWFLLNGKMYVTDNSGFLKLDMNFSKIKLNIKDDLEDLMRFGKSPRDMTGRELKEKINTFLKLGIDPSPWIVELHARYANSIGPFIIALLGVPLSLLFGLKSKSWSVILTFGIVVLYQGSGAWLAAMGKENLLNPYIAAWMPDMIFGVIGLFLFVLLDTPIAYRIREFLSKFFVVVLFLVIFGGSNLFAEEITLDASQINFFGDTVFASGNVYINWKENSLLSDYATITLDNSKAKVLEAAGNVVYEYKNNKYYAKYLKYFFDENEAYVLKVRGNFEYKENNREINLYFGASEVETYSASSLLKEAYITTCELEHPHYRIESLNVYVYEGKYIVAENSLLFILDIPFFPYPVYFTSISENEKPPFSFSFSWNPISGFSSNQNYVTYIGDFVLDTTINTDYRGSDYKFTLNNIKTNDKLSLDFEKSTFELKTEHFTYKTNWNNKDVYLKVRYAPFYFEENYSSEISWNRRLGFSYVFGKKPVRSDINLYFDYDGNKSVIYNSFSLRGIVESLNDYLKFRINTLNAKIKFSKEGFFLESSTWTANEEIKYQFSLYNERYFNTLFDVTYSDNGYISKISHRFNLPFNYSYNSFKLNANYEFVANLYNALTDQYYFEAGMYDKYTVSAKYTFEPLSIEGKYEFKNNFGSESTENNLSKFSYTFKIDSGISTISITKGWDLLVNQPINDVIKLNINYSFNELDSNLTLSTEYDNINNELLPSNINFLLTSTKFKFKYNAKFSLYHGEDIPIKEINHILSYQKLKGDILQSIEEGYIKKAYFKGPFSIGEYENYLSLSFYKSSKTEDPVINVTYSVEKNKNKFSFSYTSRSKEISFKTDLNSFDPTCSFLISYNFEEKMFKQLSLSISKQLHHWMVNLSSEFYFNGDGVFDMNDVKKLAIVFYVIEFSEKFFGWNFKENRPEIGLF